MLPKLKQITLSISILISLITLTGCYGPGIQREKPEPAEEPERIEEAEEVAEVPVVYDFDDMWDYNDVPGTESKFREILARTNKDENPDYFVQLLTQLARTQGLQGKFEDGHRLLDEAEALITDDIPVAEVRYLLERGRTINSSGSPEESKEYFLEAFELAKDIGADNYAIDAAHMMGIVETPEKQLDWNLEAIAMAERTTDERAAKWKGALYNNTGWTYHDMGEYEKALDLFQRGVKFREETGNALTIRIAKYCVGRTLRSMERYDEALAIQEALYKELEDAGESDGYIYEELAELYLVKEKQEKAKEFFALAYQDLSQDKWMMDNEPDRMARMKQLAGL